MTNTIANATLASVSETNRSRIMQHLYQHGISSRAQIAKALDLTPASHMRRGRIASNCAPL